MQKRGKYFGFLAIVWFGVSHFCQSKKYCLSPKELTIPIYLSSLFIKIQLSFKAVAATGYTYRAQRYDKTAEIPSASHQKINVNVCMSVFCTPIKSHTDLISGSDLGCFVSGVVAEASSLFFLFYFVLSLYE